MTLAQLASLVVKVVQCQPFQTISQETNMNALNARFLAAILACLSLSFCQIAKAGNFDDGTNGCPAD
jgi:hypothetical protein